MNKIKQTIEKSTNSLDKKVKQKITTSIYGTRIYLFFLTIINFIWLYCMDVKINLFSIISACIILLFLFFLYRKNGKEYMLEIVHSNLFFSLFFLVFPFSFLTLIAAAAKDFFLRDFIIWCSFASVSVFVFSALGGLIISFFPNKEVNIQIPIALGTRIKTILIMFLILLVFNSLFLRYFLRWKDIIMTTYELRIHARDVTITESGNVDIGTIQVMILFNFFHVRFYYE